MCVFGESSRHCLARASDVVSAGGLTERDDDIRADALAL
jgi:hypothetical protein